MRDPEALGRATARRFKAGGERQEVRALAAEMGVEIVERASPPPAQPGLRSEYRPDPPRIILYHNPIDELAEAVRAQGRFELAARELHDVHIAHELFHHLERVERLGPLSVELAEEAAHSFARELLGLPFNPRELSKRGN